MRFHSTPESALNGEITKLAIIECFVSVAIYLAIGIYMGAFRYLSMAIIMAPLMLFRTEPSSDGGLDAYERYLNWALKDEVLKEDSSHTIYGLVYLLLKMMVVFPIVGVGIRIVSTLYWAIRKPLHTLSEMPQNWLRQSLCTDFFHAPEMLPLEATKGDGRVLNFHSFFG